MKLRSLWIGNYRNLQDVEINFPDQPRLPVFLAVGVNGTGKSGLLRVLVHIFNALEYNQAPHIPFRLEYDLMLSGAAVYRIRIEGDGSGATSGLKFTVAAPDGSLSEVTRGGWTSYLPARIVVYTSGSLNEWQTIFDLAGADRERLEQDQTDALERLQQQSEIEELGREDRRPEPIPPALTRDMSPGRTLLVSHERLQLALLATLALEEAEAHDKRAQIYHRANVERLSRFALRLESLRLPPTEMELSQQTRAFLSTRVLDRVRRLAELAERRVRNPDGSYHLLFDMTPDVAAKLAEQFSSPMLLYDFLAELHDRGVLTRVDLVLRKTDLPDEILDRHLSDGEYEFLGRMALFMLLNQPESLFLLDEPETHFNDVWKRELVSILADILQPAPATPAPELTRPSSTVLMTTHSAIVVSDVKAEQLIVLDKDDQGRARLVDFRTPVFGADPSDVMINLFGVKRAGGEYSAQTLRDQIDNASRDELERLLDEVGPGYWRFRIRDRLESLDHAPSDPSA